MANAAAEVEHIDVRYVGDATIALDAFTPDGGKFHSDQLPAQFCPARARKVGEPCRDADVAGQHG